MSEHAETVRCGLCGAVTRMTGTRRCDRCWQLEHSVRSAPEVAQAILDEIRTKSVSAAANGRLQELKIANKYRIALILIRGEKCERVTTPGFGHCLKDGRVVSARYADDQACDSCIAHAALENTRNGEIQ